MAIKYTQVYISAKELFNTPATTHR